MPNRRVALLPALLLAVLLVPLSGAGPGEAPEPAAPKEPPPSARLLAAIAKAGSGPFAVSGSVQRKKAAGGAMGGGVIVSRSGGEKPPYEGRFHAWVPKREELVVVSPRALPGFEIFRSDDGDVTRITYESDAPSVAELRNDLVALLDTDRLAKWLGRAELEAVTDEETGAVRFSGEAPRRLVPTRSSGPMGIMKDRILRIEVALELTAEGRLAEAEFRVVRADPLPELLRKGKAFGPGGLPFEPPEPGEEREGPTAVYRLEWTGTEPAPRARSFHRAAAALLAEDD